MIFDIIDVSKFLFSFRYQEVLYRFAQIGVVSSGTGETCIDGTGVFMKVSHYKKWIKKYAPEAMDANCKQI